MSSKEPIGQKIKLPKAVKMDHKQIRKEIAE